MPVWHGSLRLTGPLCTRGILVEAGNSQGPKLKLNGHAKLVFWLLGVLASAILGISGLVASHQLSQAEVINQRLISLEVSAADRTRAQAENERRLQRIEDKLDNLQRWVK